MDKFKIPPQAAYKMRLMEHQRQRMLADQKIVDMLPFCESFEELKQLQRTKILSDMGFDYGFNTTRVN